MTKETLPAFSFRFLDWRELLHVSQAFPQVSVFLLLLNFIKFCSWSFKNSILTFGFFESLRSWWVQTIVGNKKWSLICLSLVDQVSGNLCLSSLLWLVIFQNIVPIYCYYFPYCLSVRGLDLIGIRKHAVKVLGLPVNAWSQSDKGSLRTTFFLFCWPWMEAFYKISFQSLKFW
jgi:hypothetical protein